MDENDTLSSNILPDKATAINNNATPSKSIPQGSKGHGRHRRAANSIRCVGAATMGNNDPPSNSILQGSLMTDCYIGASFEAQFAGEGR